MKLAFCCEDKTDDEILRAFAERVLGEPIEAVPQNFVVRRAGGWHEALRIAPKVAKAVFHTDAHGALFVIDNDGAEPHAAIHASTPNDRCRTCQLRRSAAVAEVLSWRRPALPPLQFVFAVPVQVLETWLLLASSRFPPNRQVDLFGKEAAERRELKKILYGDQRADRQTRLEVGLPLAHAADAKKLAEVSPSFFDFASQLAAARAAITTSL